MDIEKRLMIIACLGAHSNSGGRPFRQKHLKFLLELFTNWMDVMLKPAAPIWHNTQVMRFLNSLYEKGLAKRQGQGRNKSYQLTRVGLLELISQLTTIDGYAEFRHTLLVYYFLASYRQRMIELISKETSGFSRVVKIEIEQLLDDQRFLRRRLEELEMQVDRLRLRVTDGLKVSELAEKLERQGEGISQVVAQAAEVYPYELQNQKPMEELFREVDPTQHMWELKVGNYYRGKILWTGQLEELKAHQSILKSFLK